MASSPTRRGTARANGLVSVGGGGVWQPAGEPSRHFGRSFLIRVHRVVLSFRVWKCLGVGHGLCRPRGQSQADSRPTPQPHTCHWNHEAGIFFFKAPQKLLKVYWPKCLKKPLKTTLKFCLKNFALKIIPAMKVQTEAIFFRAKQVAQKSCEICTHPK